MEKEDFEKKEDFLKVDYAEIENFVSQHEEEYNALMDRFIGGDETLTKEELKLIYYGTAFSPNYSLLNDEGISDEILNAICSRDFGHAIILCGQALEKTPTNLQILSLAYTPALYLSRRNYVRKRMRQASENFMKNMGAEEEVKTAPAPIQLNRWEKLYDRKIEQIKDMILSTGDGSSLERAYKVTSVSDEYFILNSLGIKAVQQSLVENNDKSYDIIRDSNSDRTVYFDVTLHMKALNELIDADEEGECPDGQL